MMAWFLLESNRKFCAIFRRQVQKSCQETAGRLLIEGDVVVITNEKSASVPESGDRLSARNLDLTLFRTDPPLVGITHIG
jgi:RNase P protein component